MVDNATDRWPEGEGTGSPEEWAPGTGMSGEGEQDSGLTQAVFELVDATTVGGQKFTERLSQIETEHGEQTYTQLLTLLCHLRFEPAEAKEHWQAVIGHRALLEEKWGAPVDLRVALASYFIHIQRHLKNPTIIEMRLFERTRAFAYRDELTGLRNYRFFELYLFHEMHRSDQYAWPLSLIMIDVDDFKQYNDRNGHQAGNEALATIGRLVLDCCRKVDVAARYGGEEFAVILPSTPKLGAERVADRIRSAVESESLDAGSVTISAGIATYPGDAKTTEELIQRSDKALYEAKGKGKNQVALFGENRRSHQRVPVQLAGRVLAPGRDWSPLTTIDASEGGLRFMSDLDLAAGALLDLRLELPGHDAELVVAGRVVKSETGPKGSYGASTRVIELSNRDRQLLSDYLRESSDSTGPDTG